MDFLGGRDEWQMSSALDPRLGSVREGGVTLMGFVDFALHDGMMPCIITKGYLFFIN